MLPTRTRGNREQNSEKLCRAASCNCLIGGVLGRLHKKKGYWIKVAQWLSASAKVAGEAEWYMDITELSYKHLPSYLKP